MTSSTDVEAVYKQQLAEGRSEPYAQAYASKVGEGGIVFARHFATLRERRFLAKLNAAAERDGLVSTDPLASASGGAAKSADGGGEAIVPTRGIKKGQKTFTSAGVDGKAPVSRKKTRDDFTIMKVLGKGSYSTVHLAEEKSTGKTFAMKILEKLFIQKERKEKYVMIEKEVFQKMHFSPFIVQLHYTFQDTKRLYFVLENAPKGELLHWIKKLGSFDEECTRFYAAEILMALDHMHSVNILHRDLKPENILLSESMHVKICDFGTAKVLGTGSVNSADSFVGTAQYVSPELLNDKKACKESDLWALGCIVYQLLVGGFPFRGSNEYQTFKKITALEYEMPPQMPPKAKALVESLLVLDPNDRIGSEKCGGYTKMKEHAFWEGLPAPWDSLHDSVPPQLDAYLPAMAEDEHDLHGRDAADEDIDELLAKATRSNSVVIRKKKQDEKEKLLAKQKDESPWHGFCNPNELIIKEGLVDKRRGMLSKRRQLVLTDAPRLFYIDPQSLAVLGEIPWSKDLMPQYKSTKLFFVHTPDRTYYLEDVNKQAITWVDVIQQVQREYGGV
eukprot:m.307333 g.307333  ORF g.307333 m.307333 type:complete len:561 (-) comp16361_c0_seq8:1441-3123(-)